MLNYCNNHCWCKNTRCSRAVLWPGADIQELLPPTPKTTPPRLACCQLAGSHGAFPSLSYAPSWPLCDYQQPMKRNTECTDLLESSYTHCFDLPGSDQPAQLSTPPVPGHRAPLQPQTGWPNREEVAEDTYDYGFCWH